MLYRDNERFNENQYHDFIKMTSCPTINETQKAHYDTPVTVTENKCLKAICKLAINKSPGLNGFSIKFYKYFWYGLKHSFMESLNYSINKNRLYKSEYEGLVTLLPQPGKNLLACSYRPITLLNFDYRIISKLII